MSANDECYTPAEYVDRARMALGGRIDVDPFSNEAAQRVVRAVRFHTINTNGLTKKWRGRVWFQPPYSITSMCVAKLIEEYESGRCTAAVCLLNARTDAGWFHALSRVAWRCEKRGRIKFYGPGLSGNGNGFMASVFFYLGSEPDRFRGAFHGVGTFIPPVGYRAPVPSVTIPVTEGERVCVVCARSLEGRSIRSETCQPKCRQRRYRDRVAAGARA